MALVKAEPERFDIPHEPGEWVELRLLGWRELEKAEGVFVDGMLDKVAKNPQLMSLKDLDDGEEREESPIRDRIDHAALLRAALTGWSYKEDCTDEAKDRLDQRTKDWIIDTIIDANIMDQAQGEASAPISE